MELVGRVRQILDNNCPPENPCSPELVASVRAIVAGELPAEPTSQVTQPPSPAIAVTQAPAAQLQPPSLLRRALSYAEELSRWVRTGSPRVELPVHEERRAACDGCPLREAKTDTCLKCGCPLSDNPLGEKLWWATASCPDEPPRWKATVETE